MCACVYVHVCVHVCVCAYVCIGGDAGEGRSVYAERGDQRERDGGGERKRQRGLPQVREKSLPRRGGGGRGGKGGGTWDRVGEWGVGSGEWGETQHPSGAYSVGRYESAGVRGRPGLYIYIYICIYYHIIIY